MVKRKAKVITLSRRDFKREVMADDDPDISYLEQDAFEDRLAEYRRGDFDFVGVRASVELHIPHGPSGHAIIQRIESPGLWGIESDSGEEHLAEVFSEECDTLTDMLHALGVKVTK